VRPKGQGNASVLGPPFVQMERSPNVDSNSARIDTTLELVSQIECVLPGEYNASEEAAMSIELTPQQQHALDTKEESPPRVIDPRTNITYILLLEVDYESIRELLQEERRQQAIHAVALRNVAGRLDDIP
jgi:hypothetical protein